MLLKKLYPGLEHIQRFTPGFQGKMKPRSTKMKCVKYLQGTLMEGHGNNYN